MLWYIIYSFNIINISDFCIFLAFTQINKIFSCLSLLQNWKILFNLEWLEYWKSDWLDIACHCFKIILIFTHSWKCWLNFFYMSMSFIEALTSFAKLIFKISLMSQITILVLIDISATVRKELHNNKKHYCVSIINISHHISFSSWHLIRFQLQTFLIE